MTMNTVCCICHKKKSLRGWVKQFVEQYKDLSHGYCPECYQKTMKKLGLDPGIETHRIMKKGN